MPNLLAFAKVFTHSNRTSAEGARSPGIGGFGIGLGIGDKEWSGEGGEATVGECLCWRGE